LENAAEPAQAPERVCMALIEFEKVKISFVLISV
jgi:hypothetical protein